VKGKTGATPQTDHPDHSSGARWLRKSDHTGVREIAGTKKTRGGKRRGTPASEKSTPRQEESRAERRKYKKNPRVKQGEGHATKETQGGGPLGRKSNAGMGRGGEHTLHASQAKGHGLDKKRWCAAEKKGGKGGSFNRGGRGEGNDVNFEKESFQKSVAGTTEKGRR